MIEYLKKVLEFSVGIGMIALLICFPIPFLIVCAVLGVIGFFTNERDKRKVEQDEFVKEMEFAEARREARKAEYHDYLSSSRWREKRRKALVRDGGKCVGCGATATQVHHLRYPRHLGQERIEDLASVCASCHDKQHNADPEDRPILAEDDMPF
ncbi:MAG: hypothetical protein ACI96M_000401 [Candidatus Azotimanducaceae bacterium]|jgi:hypothetical protein